MTKRWESFPLNSFLLANGWIYNTFQIALRERNKEKPKQLENLLKQITVLRSKVWKSNIQSTDWWFMGFLFRFFCLMKLDWELIEIRLKVCMRILNESQEPKTKKQKNKWHRFHWFLFLIICFSDLNIFDCEDRMTEIASSIYCDIHLRTHKKWNQIPISIGMIICDCCNNRICSAKKTWFKLRHDFIIWMWFLAFFSIS